jgi:hypothetical protein
MRNQLQQLMYGVMIVGFILLLWIPNMQRLLDIVPPYPLAGVVATVEHIPIPTVRTIIEEEFQTQFQAWFEFFLGFKTYAVRIDNTLRFALFHDVGSAETSAMLLGKHNYLYGRKYVEQYIGLENTPQSELIARVTEMKKARDILADYNISLMYVIAPTKPEVYPEYLPKNWAMHADPERDYIRMLALLEEHDVFVYDATAMLQEYKQTQSHEVFTPGGTHWSYYGACLFLRDVLVQESDIFGDIRIDCDPPTFPYPPHGTDQDIARLTNLWDTSVFTKKSAYPTVTAVGNSKVDTILFVGDSFLWTVFDSMEKANVYNQRYFFYYNNSLYVYNKEGVGTVPIGDEWKDIVLSADLVVVEGTHGAIGTFGFGFLTDVVDRL